jgi:hypothetical protein
MAMVNRKWRFRYGYVRNQPFQMYNFSHDLALYDLAFSLPAPVRDSAFNYQSLTFPIRVYPCSSVVKAFYLRESLHFTRATTIAKMAQQQLTRFQ